MVQAAVIALTLLYCFTTLKLPEELFGFEIPLQWIAGATSLFTVVLSILLFDRIKISRLSKVFLATSTLFLIYLILDLLYRWYVSSTGEQDLYFDYFDSKRFLLDFLKYVACLLSAFAVYYSLRRSPGLLEILLRSLLISGTASIALTYIFLGLFFVGFKTDNNVLAATFDSINGGSYLGIWEAGGWLPRLAGTALEPQQFAIVFMAPLLLMLTRRYVKRFWPVVLAGVAALILSQSKFAIISLLAIPFFAWIIYRSQRKRIAILSMLIIPPVGYFLTTLPTFSQTLDEGLDSGAFVERSLNFDRLIYLIITNFWNGIGAGQYATFLNARIYGFEVLDKAYIPSMDYLKVFAETGLIGFILIGFLMWKLISKFFASYRTSPTEYREQYVALLLAQVLLLISMLFTQQFLQELFWIGAGLLMFLADEQNEQEDLQTRADEPEKVESLMGR